MGGVPWLGGQLRDVTFRLLECVAEDAEEVGGTLLSTFVGPMCVESSGFLSASVLGLQGGLGLAPDVVLVEAERLLGSTASAVAKVAENECRKALKKALASSPSSLKQHLSSIQKSSPSGLLQSVQPVIQDLSDALLEGLKQQGAALQTNLKEQVQQAAEAQIADAEVNFEEKLSKQTALTEAQKDEVRREPGQESACHKLYHLHRIAGVACVTHCCSSVCESWSRTQASE